MVKNDENWSVLNFLNTIPELEKLSKIKNRKNLKTFFSRSKSLQRRNFREKYMFLKEKVAKISNIDGKEKMKTGLF
jgi:polyphosphate kinase 2 (PPK2 family)